MSQLFSKTSTGSIMTGRGKIAWVQVTGTAAASTIDIHDGTDANGRLIFSLRSRDTIPIVHNFHHDQDFTIGLFMVVTGVGSTGQVGIA